MHTEFWFGSLKGRDQLRNLIIDGRSTFRRITHKCVVKMWTGCAIF